MLQIYHNDGTQKFCDNTKIDLVRNATWSQAFSTSLLSFLWPQMVKITEKAGNRHLLSVLVYPGAGHLIEPPYTPHHRASNFMIEGKDKGMCSHIKKSACITMNFTVIYIVYNVSVCSQWSCFGVDRLDCIHMHKKTHGRKFWTFYTNTFAVPLHRPDSSGMSFALCNQ